MINLRFSGELLRVAQGISAASIGGILGLSWIVSFLFTFPAFHTRTYLTRSQRHPYLLFALCSIWFGFLLPYSSRTPSSISLGMCNRSAKEAAEKVENR